MISQCNSTEYWIEYTEFWLTWYIHWLFSSIFIDYSLLLLCLFPRWQQPQENSLRTGIYYFYYVPSKSHLLSSTSLSSMKLEIFLGSNKDFQRTSCVKAGVALAYLREYRGKREVAWTKIRQIPDATNTFLITSWPICLSYKSKWAFMSFIMLGSTYFIKIKLPDIF